MGKEGHGHRIGNKCKEGWGGEGHREKQVRWSGLSGYAHLLHLSHIIFGPLEASFTYDFPPGVFDIMEREPCDSVSVFLASI